MPNVAQLRTVLGITKLAVLNITKYTQIGLSFVPMLNATAVVVAY